MAKCGEEARVNSEEVKEKEEKTKKCVVHFRPKDDWRGGYGFDWVRLPSDPYKEVHNRHGHVSMSTLHCMGKYVCPAKKVVISARKDDGNIFQATQEVTPFDIGNYNADLEGDPVYFCRNYIKYHGLSIPVNGNSAIMYELKGGKKTVSFSRDYSIVGDEKGDEDKKNNKKKDKKKVQKSQRQEKVKLQLLDLPNSESSSVGQGDCESNSGGNSTPTLELLGIDSPPEYTPYKKLCYLDYKYTFEKGKFKELHVKETFSQRELTLTSKSQLKKVSKKDKEFFMLKGDIVDDCWMNKNMNAESLSKNSNNMFVEVDNEGSKTVRLEEHSGSSFVLNYEDGVLVNAMVTTGKNVTKLKSQNDIVKKGAKAGLTSDMIKDINLDFMSLLKSMSYKSFSIIMENPSKFAMLPISYHAEKKNGETRYVVDCFNGNDNTDDNLLHDYSIDYTIDRCMKIRDPYGQFNTQPCKGIYWDVMDYYYSVLAIPYSRNKKYEGIGGEAEIQLFISGDYDKIELKPDDDKLIKLSETKIKKGENCKLTVKVEKFFHETFVRAFSDGNEVGRLKVSLNILKTVKLCLISVSIRDKDIIYDVSEKGWSPQMEDTAEILLQAGIKLDTSQARITVNYKDFQGYFDSDRPKKVIIRDSIPFDYGSKYNTPLVDFLEGQLKNNRNLYNNCSDSIRVYVLDVARVNDGNFYIHGYRWPGVPDVVLLFKKCIDGMKMEKSNVIAHELGHLMGLEHSYHNNEEFTMQYECTANVMDVSEVKYALTESQWKTVHDKAFMKYIIKE